MFKFSCIFRLIEQCTKLKWQKQLEIGIYPFKKPGGLLKGEIGLLKHEIGALDMLFRLIECLYQRVGRVGSWMEFNFSSISD
ncbi:hypothetical protein CYJ36_21365 [Bacillus sp. UMB0893]|nr:hypothetical protein CYJ36_21365 [Bacillus sp. UMB0893]